PLVTMRVDDKMKHEMDRLEGINWSEILRGTIREVLDRETRRNRLEAARSMDRLRRRARPGWDSTAFIRGVRDSRYGPGRHRRELRRARRRAGMSAVHRGRHSPETRSARCADHSHPRLSRTGLAIALDGLVEDLTGRIREQIRESLPVRRETHLDGARIP